MEKKIQKKQREIIDAQHDRAMRKTKYDTQVVILEARRNEVRELENMSEKLLNEFVDSDNTVKRLIQERDQLAQQMEQNEEQNT